MQLAVLVNPLLTVRRPHLVGQERSNGRAILGARRVRSVRFAELLQIQFASIRSHRIRGKHWTENTID